MQRGVGQNFSGDLDDVLRDLLKAHCNSSTTGLTSHDSSFKQNFSVDWTVCSGSGSHHGGQAHVQIPAGIEMRAERPPAAQKQHCCIVQLRHQPGPCAAAAAAPGDFIGRSSCIP